MAINFGIPQNPVFTTATATTTINVTSTGTGFRVYATSDQTTNIKRSTFSATGVGTETVGTATSQAFSIYAQDANAAGIFSQITINRGAAPYFRQGLYSTSTGNTIIGTGATGTLFTMCSFNSTASSGVVVAMGFTPTYNQTSTAGSTDFQIVRTETAIGSGVHKFAEFFAGTLGTTSMFSISNTGAVSAGTPNGGVSGAWKTGAARTSVGLVVSATTGIQIDVGGTLYTLAVLTTNP